MAKTKRKGNSPLLLIKVIWAVSLLALIYTAVVWLLLEHDLVVLSDILFFCMDIGALVSAATFVLALILSVLYVLEHLTILRNNSNSGVDDLRRMLSSQTNTQAMLTQISENLLLSDAIKAVAFRDKDRTVLEDAIEQDMRMEKWESAEVLIDELAKRFGGKQEAEELHENLHHYRNATIEEKIDSTVKHIESLWLIHHYEEAEQEIASLARLYPDNAKVQSLQGQTENRRQEHKKELLDRWDKAVKANDIDQGVELLKLLDTYLTPTEAAALEESARGVFRAKLHNMGVQFSLFVTEKRWDNALKLGKQIIEEFPNSRMAQEVREKLMVLEQRATTGPQ